MSELKATHELHGRRFSRNLGVGLTLVFLVAVVFGLTVVKVQRGELNEGFDHVVRPAMEIDSLEAIEALVRHGLGVSVVPDRGPMPGIARVPFGAPQTVRRLVLMTRPRTPRARLIQPLAEALLNSQ